MTKRRRPVLWGEPDDLGKRSFRNPNGIHRLRGEDRKSSPARESE